MCTKAHLPNPSKLEKSYGSSLDSNPGLWHAWLYWKRTEQFVITDICYRLASLLFCIISGLT